MAQGHGSIEGSAAHNHKAISGPQELGGLHPGPGRPRSQGVQDWLQRDLCGRGAVLSDPRDGEDAIVPGRRAGGLHKGTAQESHTNVMFSCAVSRPDPSPDFDGKIYVWRGCVN